MRRAVFVHPRGVGQFRHLAAHLAEAGWGVTAFCDERDVAVPGVAMRVLKPAAEPRSLPAPVVFAARYAEAGHRVADALEALAATEGTPDLVVGHMGWGSLLFARDVLPQTPILGYCEYFFRAEGGDLGFDPAAPATTADRRRLRARNMAQLASIDAIDAGFTPTRWQQSLYPAWAKHRIAVCHDGIDTDFCSPGPAKPFPLPGGRRLMPGDPVVTFCARSLEPHRGFPQFMRAAAKVAAGHPDATFVVVGGDDVSYGMPPPGGSTWRAELLAESGLDPARMAFLGRIDHQSLVELFRLSAAHVYLTVPFVLSWSMLEAMACGALVIGSATPPVEEVIEHGRNGLLADFWDSDALAEAILAALRRPEQFRDLRRAAIRTVQDRYALPECLERQLALVNRLVN